MVPRKSSMRRSARTSRSTLSAERFWITRPSCSVIEQKVQPPKQPRMSTSECFTVSKPGSRSRVHRVRHAVERQVVQLVHRDGVPPLPAPSSSGSAGGLKYTPRSPWRWTSGRALQGLVSSWKLRDISANARLSATTSS